MERVKEKFNSSPGLRENKVVEFNLAEFENICYNCIMNYEINILEYFIKNNVQIEGNIARLLCVILFNEFPLISEYTNDEIQRVFYLIYNHNILLKKYGKKEYTDYNTFDEFLEIIFSYFPFSNEYIGIYKDKIFGQTLFNLFTSEDY